MAMITGRVNVQGLTPESTLQIKSQPLTLTLLLFILIIHSGLSHAASHIATAEPLATSIGAEILAAGGNACDAAIAVAFALAVTYPQAGNIGGGGFALVYEPESDPWFLDFRETAPAAAHREMFLDGSGEVIPKKSLVGGAAVGTPGSVAGLEELHRRCGSLPWSFLVTPAVELAQEGFKIQEGLADDLNDKWDLLERFPTTAKTFGKNGVPLLEGDLLRQRTLAKTLSRIALKGSRGFYEGSVARDIVKSCQRHGGLLSRQDLRNYCIRVKTPYHLRYRGREILAAPLPSSGGLCLSGILTLMETLPFESYHTDPTQYWQRFIAACQLAYRDRALYMGDSDYYNVPVGMLLDPNRILGDFLKRDFTSALPADCFGEITAPSPESVQTTHLSVLDSEGRSVSLTTTLNATFGCGVMAAGFLLNNEMDDFSAKPGIPNLYGLVGAEANAIEAGKRPLSSMSPTLVMEDGKPLYVLGTPGGSRIITTVAQILLHLLDGGLSLQQALAQPRIHNQWLPDSVFVEEAFSPSIAKDLSAMGYHLVREKPWCNTQAVSPDQGGASDPRGYGTAQSVKSDRSDRKRHTSSP